MKRAAVSLAVLVALAAGVAKAAPAGRERPASPGRSLSAATPQAPYAMREIASPDDFNGRVNCTLLRLEACGNTNALIWDEPFREALAAFLGERRRTYLWHEDGTEGPDATAPLVSDSFREVLGGPPDPVMRVGPYFAFSGCRQHSCPEKGIAVLTREGELVALGILHYWNAAGEVEERACCGDNPDFDIYHRPVADIARLLPALRAWAGERAEEGYRLDGQPPARLRGLRLFAVTTGAIGAR